MSNDGEGASTLLLVAAIAFTLLLVAAIASTLLLVAVVDHLYGNASYYGGHDNPPEALRTVQRR